MCVPIGVFLFYTFSNDQLMRIDSDTIPLRKHALVLLRNVFTGFALNKKKSYDVTLRFLGFLASIAKNDLCCKFHIWKKHINIKNRKLLV